MNYKTQNDETLVLLTLAGDGDAFEALVLRHQNAVIAAAASVTHNRFMAEDASQDPAELYAASEEKEERFKEFVKRARELMEKYSDQ